jgi:hypothetical protein
VDNKIKEKSMIETAILVLLYNKEMSDSNTLTSLTESETQYTNARLIIWNNGPKSLKCRDRKVFEKLGYDVVFEETLNNESLAVIYNRFLAENNAEKYILLDDDSVLNSAYIEASSKCNASVVGMPIISSLGKIRSPSIGNKAYSPKLVLDEKCKIIAIGTGLVIGANICSNLHQYYKNVFDERFYLYGVDTTFCIRLFERKLTSSINIIPGFNHSLSRLKNESIKKTNFRRLERSYDQGLTLRYYYPLLIAIFYLFRVTASTLKRRLFKQSYTLNIIHLFKAFLFGKHHRQLK